ncbi:hypothetical protein J3Q64DRAFT_1716051, partial [Phycomyces blakesleeanus]
MGFNLASFIYIAHLISYIFFSFSCLPVCTLFSLPLPLFLLSYLFFSIIHFLIYFLSCQPL